VLDNFNYTRDVRPDVRGYGPVGYADTVNSPATVFTTSTTNLNTITAAVGVNYLPSQTLTGAILYSFTYHSNVANLSGGNGDAVVNQLQFLLSKTF